MHREQYLQNLLTKIFQFFCHSISIIKTPLRYPYFAKTFSKFYIETFQKFENYIGNDSSENY